MEIVIHNDLEDTNWSVTTIILHLEKEQYDGLLLSCDQETMEDVKSMYIRLRLQTGRLGSFYLIVQCKFA